MHINDTLICGDGLCNLEVVEMVVKDGPKRVLELIDWGANFDKNIAGNLDLGREGGHTKNRVVHHKDQTGIEIERTILEETHRKKNRGSLLKHSPRYLLMMLYQRRHAVSYRLYDRMLLLPQSVHPYRQLQTERFPGFLFQQSRIGLHCLS